MRKDCVICGIEFQKLTRGNRKTCSQGCSNDLRLETYQRIHTPQYCRAQRQRSALKLKIYAQKYYQENRERYAERWQRYYAEHRDDLRRQQRAYWENGGRELQRLRREANPELYRQKGRDRYQRQMKKNGAAIRSRWRRKDRQTRAYAMAARELGLFTGSIRIVHKSMAKTIRNFIENGETL